MILFFYICNYFLLQDTGGKFFFFPIIMSPSLLIEFPFPHSSMMLPLLSKEFLHIFSMFMSFKTVFHCLSVLVLVLHFFFLITYFSTHSFRIITLSSRKPWFHQKDTTAKKTHTAASLFTFITYKILLCITVNRVNLTQLYSWEQATDTLYMH